MRFHHVATIFLVLVVAFFAYTSLKSSVDKRAYQNAVKCENELTSSLLDAMTDVVQESSNGVYIFDSEEKRKLAFDEFYATLSLNLNEYLTKELFIQDTIPCIFMVDTDGYYVVYRDLDNENNLQTLVSPLNTWSEAVGNGTCVLRYYLGDYVKIIDRVTGTQYEGSVEEVKALTEEDGIGYLVRDYISSYEDYASEREYFIWNSMQEQMNYYVNKYNVRSEYIYELQIPMTRGMQKGHPIDKPCMFAMMQGRYFGIHPSQANVFAYANSEVIDGITYYCTSDGYYHRATCPNITTVEYRGSMKNCAKHGYSPCMDCN